MQFARQLVSRTSLNNASYSFELNASPRALEHSLIKNRLRSAALIEIVKPAVERWLAFFSASGQHSFYVRPKIF